MWTNYCYIPIGNQSHQLASYDTAQTGGGSQPGIAVEESVDGCDIHLIGEFGRGRVEDDTQYGGETTEEGKYIYNNQKIYGAIIHHVQQSIINLNNS